MTEIARITDLLEQTFEGKPYYGPSVLASHEHVGADAAAARPEIVSTGRPADSPAFPCDLNEPDEIKRCVVRRLRALVRRNFDKETDSLPSNFQF